jgi:hypothetical protein
MKSLFAYRRSATTESVLSERFHGGVVSKCKRLSKYESSSVMGKRSFSLSVARPRPQLSGPFGPQPGMGNVVPNRKIQASQVGKSPRAIAHRASENVTPRLSLRSGNGTRNFTILSFARKQMTADVSLVM